ncbi:unconventional prefoldin RPB5 interactor 1-like [Daphnia carinata]|uniref:unconventional prefoldin RPB5 interactor 1-like n=1 Tax=Daphnia carinata TaxID=120202 RepID=UPI00258024BC|nr:unconventional prefoldin RPB5 interactor 1-like [Daphnia carinata]
MATVDTRDVSLQQQNLISPVPSVNSNPLAQLLQHQTKETEIVRGKVKQLTKFREDYEALKARLETLPDKISHEVMVPFGKLAFIPGRVKHTNEILCLLGENWFVERSAKQAAQMVERRIKECDETLKKFQGELKLMDGWCDQTKKLSEELNLNQGVNITETEEDEGWREEHRIKVREYKQKMALLKQQAAEESHERSEEEELWRRLDELELEEEFQHELDLLGVGDGELEEEDEEVNEGVKEEQEEERKKKSVRWSESPDAVKQFRRDELILPRMSGTAYEDDNQDTLKITFKHSSASSAGSNKSKFVSFIPVSVDANNGDPSSSLVSSPSELFRKYRNSQTTTDSSVGESMGAGEPKSILKVKKSTTPVIEIVQQRKEERPDGGSTADPDRSSFLQQQQIPAAMGDEVKERGETASSLVATAQGEDEESVNTHRPVSRFRAARMNKKL